MKPIDGIYFIRCETERLVKIGYASDIARRFSQLQVASPHRLEIIGVMVHYDRSNEKQLHEYFAGHRVRGEWFRLAPHIQRYIDKHSISLEAARVVTDVFWLSSEDQDAVHDWLSRLVSAKAIVNNTTPQAMLTNQS